MKIFRTENNKYGWRWKICVSEDGKTVKVSQESNHEGYWKEMRTHHIWGSGVVLLKNILEKELGE